MDSNPIPASNQVNVFCAAQNPCFLAQSREHQEVNGNMYPLKNGAYNHCGAD
jgi:hypothetical protein